MFRRFIGWRLIAIALTVAVVLVNLVSRLTANVVLLKCLNGVMNRSHQMCATQPMVDDRFLYYRGISALESNQPLLASRFLSTYVRDRPQDRVAGLFLGIALSRDGNVPAAYRAWRKADASAFFWKRGVARNDPNDIETALTIGPADAGMLYALGCAYESHGEQNKAVAAYEAFRRSQHEQLWSYWMASAYIATAQGSNTVALEDYRRASRSAPEVLLPRYRIGETARKVGNFRLAADEYQGILALAPHELYATVGLAEMHWAMGDIGGAERSLKRAVGEFPSSSLPPLDLAALFLEQNRAGEAVASAEEALRRDPSSKAAQHLRADALSRRAGAGDPK